MFPLETLALSIHINLWLVSVEDDITRVKLKNLTEDYINANYVNVCINFFRVQLFISDVEKQMNV